MALAFHPRSGSSGEGVALRDTEILRERGRAAGVPGVETAACTKMTASGGESKSEAPPLLTEYYR